MNWTVKFENKPNIRVNVLFEPLKDSVVFYGQSKEKMGWYDFVKEEHAPFVLDLEKVQEIIYSIYNKLISKIESYENINNIFDVIKVVEINDENNLT
jgi:hypothetical protein